MSDPLAKIDDDSMVRWGNVRFEFGRLQYELNVALTELARLTPAPGCSLVVSVGVDGTTSTTPVTRYWWDLQAGELTTQPQVGDVGCWFPAAVPVRDPQERHDG
jgi:hypothetical protein